MYTVYMNLEMRYSRTMITEEKVLEYLQEAREEQSQYSEMGKDWWHFEGMIDAYKAVLNG